MMLTRLEIRDVGPVDHLALDFGRCAGGVMVLAGAHGCGKSTVLDAVLVALGRPDLLPVEARDLVRRGATDFQVRATWLDHEDGEPRVSSVDAARWKRLEESRFWQQYADPSAHVAASLEEMAWGAPDPTACRVICIQSDRELDVRARPMSARATDFVREFCGVAPPTARDGAGRMAVEALACALLDVDLPVDLCLLDEPELHLHPSWQRSILGALRAASPGTQWVVATQSSEVLDSVAGNERFVLLAEACQLPEPDGADGV